MTLCHESKLTYIFTHPISFEVRTEHRTTNSYDEIYVFSPSISSTVISFQLQLPLFLESIRAHQYRK